MADTKFSALLPVTAGATDVVPVIQGGVPSRTTPSSIAALATKTTVGLSNVQNVDTTTTANITDSINKRFITDAQQTVLSNTSGTNTGDAATPAETTTTIGTLISGAIGNTTPVDTDSIGLSDSAASNVLKKLTWANVKATLKTYFDTLYAAVSHTHTQSDITNLTSDLSGKQATLVSGTNIKTINGSSVLGSGDLTISGGSVSDAAYGAGWDGDTTTAPSKNAVYDKIETLSAGSGLTFAQSYSITTLDI
ncbi:hypothetical protein [Caudoviricetes sp.]|nr:hypothetical protein [Caudoviricetes sp.]